MPRTAVMHAVSVLTGEIYKIIRIGAVELNAIRRLPRAVRGHIVK